ncbi:hypothetical protein [Burkholderia multivorans]|uniref:hypothetical protein n=1 Tax=Burkholderia multivorans TaxID=87883 RepID=UPI001907DFD8|nr:hypothetical protein [Burkholderia multivorans]MBJ9622097.1 hypothetical protein [Burkholderia multivorans]
MNPPLLDRSSLNALKRTLLDCFPRIRSAHLSEALAFGLGFRTNAALKVELDRPEAERPPMTLDLTRLRERLHQLGYTDDNGLDAARAAVRQEFPDCLSSSVITQHAHAVGFDTLNLAAAVEAVMKSAAEKDQEVTFSIDTAKRIDLRDREQVRAHLIDQVRRHYSRAKQRPGGVRIATIERVVFSPVGFVFEKNIGQMHPAPVTEETDGAVMHLAYFWSVL